MKPSIGRIVHYVRGSVPDVPDAGMIAPSDHSAAIITQVWSETCVNLVVFPKGSPLDSSHAGVKTSVVFSNEGTPYSWHWPEQV